MFLLINLISVGSLACICGYLTVKGILPQNWTAILAVCIAFIACVISCSASGIRTSKNIALEFTVRIVSVTAMYGILHLCIMNGTRFHNPWILAAIVCGVLIGSIKAKRGVVQRYR